MRCTAPLIVALLALSMIGCSCSDGGDSCATRDDCAAGEVCLDGRCTLPGDAGPHDAATDDGSMPDGGAIEGRRCTDERPCPDGYLCEEGACALDCGTDARCEGVCCGAGEVCYLAACVVPGAACGGGAGTCIATGACDEDEQCDPALGRCLPRAVDSTCELRPEGDLTPELLWSWTGSTAHPLHQHVLATPAVADLDGDGASDVIVPVTDFIPGSLGRTGILCALSGLGTARGARASCGAPRRPVGP